MKIIESAAKKSLRPSELVRGEAYRGNGNNTVYLVAEVGGDTFLVDLTNGFAVSSRAIGGTFTKVEAEVHIS